MFKLFFSFLALIFNWKLIWLRDTWNDIYLTRIRKSKNVFTGEIETYCYVYNFTKVGKVLLLDNGVCQSHTSSYIKEWKLYK